MKNLIFYFLILLSTSLFAQNKVDHKHKINGGIDNCKDNQNEMFNKMSNSKISVQRTYLSNSSSQNREVLLGETKFNSQGRPTEIKSFSVDGKVNSVRTKKYDTKGNLTELASLSADNKVSESMVKKYDEFGRVIESNDINSQGVRTGKTESRYDRDGKLEEVQGYSGDNVLVVDKTFSYDNSGNMLSKSSKNGTGKEINLETYKYNDHGIMIEDKITNFDTKTSYKYTWEYDNNGNVTEMKRFFGDNEVIEKYNYKYDVKGNVIETEFINKAGIHTILTDKYDNNDNKIEEILKLNDGSLSSKTTWVYDSTGNVTEEKQWDVNTGQVRQNTRYEYVNFK